MKSELQQRSFLFRPTVVLLISVGTATLYGLYSLRSTKVGLETFRLSGSFFYVVPIIVPFVAFLMDRAEDFCKSLHFGINRGDNIYPTLTRRLKIAHKAVVLRTLVDSLIVALAVGRVIANVPFISGHTLFLSYAILTTRSRIVLLTASVVMLHAIYLKYFVWHDVVTSTSGIILAALSAYLVNRLMNSRKDHRYG